MGARVAVAGASGYAGGELLRLLAGHPDLEIAAVTAGPQRGPTVGRLHPHLAGCPAWPALTLQPHEPPRWPAATWSSWRCRPASRRRWPRAARPRSRSWTSGRTSGWPTRPRGRGTTAARTPAAGSPACRSCRARASGSARPAGWRRPAATPPRRSSRSSRWWRRAWPIRADVVVVAASGTSGAGRSLRTDLLASEVMGSVSAYQVAGAHRHTPEIEQALAEARRRRPADRAAAHRPASASPRARADAARHPGHLHRPARRPGVSTGELREAIAAAYDGEPFVTAAARRRAGRPPRRWPGPTACTCRSPPTRGPAAPSSSPRSTTSARARPARPSRTPTSCSACPRPPA